MVAHNKKASLTRMTILLVASVRGGGSFHSFDCIIQRKNLYIAWSEFVKGKKYKKDVSEFSLSLDQNLRRLFYDLKNKTYRHRTYTHFVVTDPKKRDIHKAVVRDRIVHHLLYTMLYPYFDRKFIYDSYSCRTGKGMHKAMNRFRYFAGKISHNHTRTCWVLKCDIRKFFASVDHDILKSILESHITDTSTLNLLCDIIDSFHTDGKHDVGLPLGNLTSQLLVNVYMNEFDQYMKHTLKTKYYVRYADDFVILSQDKQYLDNILLSIDIFLKERLKLQLHPNKVFTKTYVSGVDFLGWVHFPYHRVLRTSTKRRMIKRMKETQKKEVRDSYSGMLKWGNTWKVSKKVRLEIK
jgi:RNA-directed DNA polymerase